MNNEIDEDEDGILPTPQETVEKQIDRIREENLTDPHTSIMPLTPVDEDGKFVEPENPTQLLH